MESVSKEQSGDDALGTLLQTRMLTDAARLLDAIGEGFITLDPDFRITYINARASRINRKPVEAFLHRTHWEEWPASVGTQMEREYRHVMTERVPVHFQYRYYVEGEYDVWLDIRAYPDEEGGGIHIAYRDITEQKRSDSRVRHLFDSSVVGVIFWNLDTGKITDANDTFLTMVGYTRHELEAGLLDFRAMTPPEWAERNEQGVATIRDEGYAPTYEKEYFRKDGSRLPILIGGTRFKDSEAEGYSYVLDISEQKQVEARFRALVTASSQMVWSTGPDGLIVDMPEWREYSGQTEDEVRGYGWANAIHPEDRDHVTQTWLRAFHAKSLYECEYRVRSKDGKYRWFFARGVPLLKDNGELREYIGTFADIHARKTEDEKHIRVAETLQRSLLIRADLLTFPGIEVFPYYEAATDEALIGGDLYDVFALHNDKVALIVGDATGKGLVAASDTADFKFTLRAYLRLDPDPATALHRMNRHVLDRHALDDKSENSLLCVTVAVLDTKTGEVTICAAGAEPSLILCAETGEVEEIIAAGPVLGAMEDWRMPSVTRSLHAGSVLMFYTDGLTDARRGRKEVEFFETAGVVRALQNASPLGSLNQMAESIVREAKVFANNRLGDDVCLLLARWNREPG